ncbi:Holliday junction branch migration protein RuvA [Rhodobacteraceae bacterium NNCM2]|nr:Holliday junction branch migration protein RuvA [Coraliihabitans acroporae]
MIGKITGRIDYVAEDHVLLEASGVGYIIHCTSTTLSALPPPGSIAALYTEMVVREDLMQLFGFQTRAEKEWHRLLVSVQGVGAKVSLGLLGALGTNGLGRALAVGDVNAIRSAPGVGPKLATRIATELKGKAPDILSLSNSLATSLTGAAMPVGDGQAEQSPAPAPAAQMPARRPDLDESAMVAAAEAVSALVNLGYDRAEAMSAVAEAGDGTTAELIRLALKSLGQKL